MNNSNFLEQYPNVNAIGAVVFEIMPSVSRLLNLKDIFQEFNVAKEDRTFSIQLMMPASIKIKDQASICATENSIESVKVDRVKKVIIIKVFEDHDNLKIQ